MRSHGADQLSLRADHERVTVLDAVDERARGTPRADFTTAHELGHHLLHPQADHFKQCEGEERSNGAFVIEREASAFSTELLMHAPFAAPLCTAARPTLDDVDKLARVFRTSFQSSGIRYVELAQTPCAFVLALHGRIKWAPETAAFPGKIVKGRQLHARSIAAKLMGRRAGADPGPREVPGEAWGGEAPFMEHALVLGPAVLSWIIPAS